MHRPLRSPSHAAAINIISEGFRPKVLAGKPYASGCGLYFYRVRGKDAVEKGRNPALSSCFSEFSAFELINV